MKQMGLFLLLNLFCYQIFAQPGTIKGRVISEELEPLPGIYIMINDTTKIGETDLDGYFNISITKSIKEITFACVGFYPATVELVDTCIYMEVILFYSPTCDFMSFRRIERKRRKKFKQLTILHKQAYEEGLFKKEQPCYKRDFQYIYLKKDKR